MFVTDTGSGTVFGPFPVGTTIKYTEANGATPSSKKMGSSNGEAGERQERNRARAEGRSGTSRCL